MSRARLRPVLTVAAVMCMSILMMGQDRDRAKVADRYKWNLADIYPSAAAWRAEKEKIAAQLATVRAHAGKLGSSAGALADTLETMSRLDKELSRLYVYASMVADEDTRESVPQGMQQEMQQIYAEFGAQASFIEPEILRVGAPTIEKFIAAEPRLKTYNFFLHDVLRRAPHTLSDAEEKLLADAQPLAGSASNI